MARIAFAWEYGNSIGHAIAAARLADALRLRGHEVALVLRDLQALRVLPETRDLPAFQAPIWVSDVPAFHPRTFAEAMAGAGYRDENTLSGLLGAWHAIFGGWKADLVIADYAPTALLAARALGIRRATYGNGFFTPPRATPLPPFRTDAAAAEIRDSETYVLGVVNGALARFGATPLERLSQQFETSEDFLCTFPELDHYESRPGASYWGPRLAIDRGRLADWPDGPGKRVLVYVPASMPALDPLMTALRNRGHSVIAFVPRLDPARRKAYSSPRIRMAEGPVRLDRILPRCDLVVSLGGDIAPATVSLGIAQLVLPTQFEQHLTGLRIEALGAGLAVRGENAQIPVSTPGNIVEPLERVLTQPAFTLAARTFRARYAAWSPAEQLRRVVLRIDEILR